MPDVVYRPEALADVKEIYSYVAEASQLRKALLLRIFWKNIRSSSPMSSMASAITKRSAVTSYKKEGAKPLLTFYNPIIL